MPLKSTPPGQHQLVALLLRFSSHLPLVVSDKIGSSCLKSRQKAKYGDAGQCQQQGGSGSHVSNCNHFCCYIGIALVGKVALEE